MNKIDKADHLKKYSRKMLKSLNISARLYFFHQYDSLFLEAPELRLWSNSCCDFQWCWCLPLTVKVSSRVLGCHRVMPEGFSTQQ